MIPTIPTQIFNMALGLLGQKPVNDIVTNPQSSIEQTGRYWYDVTRRSLLMSYVPNFATKGEAVQRIGTSTVTKFPDIYAFPNDYLKLTAIEDPQTPLQNYVYMIQEKNLLINNGGATSIELWFVYDVIDISKYPENFIKLLAGELAVTVAPSVTKLSSMVASAEKFRDKARLEVLGSNGQVKPPIRYERSSVVRAGLSGSSHSTTAGQYTFNFDPN